MLMLKNKVTGLFFQIMADDTGSIEAATKFHPSRREMAEGIALGRGEAGLGFYEVVEA